MTKERYQSLPVKTLRELAKARGIRGMSTQKKAVIIDAMLELDAREAAAEESGASEAKDVSRDMSGGDQAVHSRDEDAASDDTPSESSPTPQQRRVLKIEESEQAHSFEQAKTESPAGDEKREEKRDKSVYVPGAIPGDQGNTVRGLLEIMTDGFGFLRSANFLPGEEDVYVSPSQIRRFNLKTGDMVEGNKREKAQGEKYGALIYVSRVNDRPADEARRRFTFENMTPIFPNRRIRLERPDGSRAPRIVDLMSPIGYGQRGMIVSPPKAGKTTLLKDIAKSILTTNPNTYLIILLIDERPEEVTDMKESVKGRHVEILYSTFDETPEHHKRVSEMVIERAKRLVEQKEDVIILLDSITRLARAYNIIVAPSGRTLSGGPDPTALYMPKRFFGAARNMREGGSLTILATALVDTGSKMDDVVYEEFKGTGNMELILDRKLQERRMFPAIDIVKSGTRREDLLLTPKERRAVDIMRRRMNGLKAEDAVETILDEFTRLPTNEMVVDQILARWK
ncbi:MAG: transcription termination factor Rho [Lachnospiraceae bacterium]|nr:transcription termination factor Rho [Lachnospiraceae bacterium]